MATDERSPACELSFEDWLNLGIEAGYCSPVVCNTHDGLPSTEEEDQAWEAGGDPCVPAVRLYEPVNGL
jgi:hypothetical protein